MVFPFVKIFENDGFSCLEAVMVVIVNYCQKWFEYYPNPPIEMLDLVEDILELHSPDLLSHFVANKITSQIYAWIPLQNFLSEIFSRDDWCVVWDHLFINKPVFLYFIMAAFLDVTKIACKSIKTVADYTFYLTRVNVVNIKHVINRAYTMMKSTPKSLISNRGLCNTFEPLSQGSYPIYNKYPTYIVNYRNQLKEKIRFQEQEYIRRRKMTGEVSRLADQLVKDRQKWESADWKTSEMVDKWWDTMINEERMRNDKLVSMNAAEKEERARAMDEIASGTFSLT